METAQESGRLLYSMESRNFFRLIDFISGEPRETACWSQ